MGRQPNSPFSSFPPTLHTKNGRKGNSDGADATSPQLKGKASHQPQIFRFLDLRNASDFSYEQILCIECCICESCDFGESDPYILFVGWIDLRDAIEVKARPSCSYSHGFGKGGRIS